MQNKLDETAPSMAELEKELKTFFLVDEVMLSEWINTPLPILEGERPADLLKAKWEELEFFMF